MSMKILYTSRDFDSYFDTLKQLVVDKFEGSWTDFNKSNIGVLFLELLSAIGDQNSYYLNNIANEWFLPTVTRRRNAIKIKMAAPTQIQSNLLASIPPPPGACSIS